MPQELYLNGIDADTGDYINEGITAEMIARIARGQSLSEEEKFDLNYRKNISGAHYGVAEGVDANDLSSAGWSVIFPADLPQKSVDALKEALKPLLDHRRGQATQYNEIYYREVIGKELGFRTSEGKNAFLKRFGRGPGPVVPEKYPYYALIVGSPDTIPFTFQYQLDMQYAVGRVYFEKLEDYYNYAVSVVQAETRQVSRGKKATFWGVANPDDPATKMSSQYLIDPLAREFKSSHEDWKTTLLTPEKSNKSNLASHMGGSETPAFLFTASHGIKFRMGDARQLRHQGALLTQEWPGPRARQPLTDGMYFSADDIPSDADVFGMFAFIFACYGGGTPRMDDFYRQALSEPKQIAPYGFLAGLPTRLLTHPKGSALGVFAHIERAWGASIMWDNQVADVATFDSLIDSLASGETAGMATEYFNERYAEISSDLTTELQTTDENHQDEIKIANMWTSNNDARNYVFLGDPAVRLAVESKETPKPQRASLGEIVSKRPKPVTDMAAGFQPDVVVFSEAVTDSGGAAESYTQPAPPDKAEPIPAANMPPELAAKLRALLDQLLEDAAGLEVATYVAEDAVENVSFNKTERTLSGARKRAVTYIGLNGDTRVVAPVNESGEVDAALWQVHLEAVRHAQESRARVLEILVQAATPAPGKAG